MKRKNVSVPLNGTIPTTIGQRVINFRNISGCGSSNEAHKSDDTLIIYCLSETLRIVFVSKILYLKKNRASYIEYPYKHIGSTRIRRHIQGLQFVP